MGAERVTEPFGAPLRAPNARAMLCVPLRAAIWAPNGKRGNPRRGPLGARNGAPSGIQRVLFVGRRAPNWGPECTSP